MWLRLQHLLQDIVITEIARRKTDRSSKLLYLKVTKRDIYIKTDGCSIFIGKKWILMQHRRLYGSLYAKIKFNFIYRCKYIYCVIIFYTLLIVHISGFSISFYKEREQRRLKCGCVPSSYTPPYMYTYIKCRMCGTRRCHLNLHRNELYSPSVIIAL